MDHKRVALRLQNASPATKGTHNSTKNTSNNIHTIVESSKLDSALKKHTALIKRMRQSMASDNRDQILKDIDTLSLEKYLDEIVAASIDGISRCKSEKDVWSAVEILSALHRRFPTSFTPNLVSALSTSLSVPSRASLSNLTPDQREKEDSARVVRQRPVLRVCSELALVGVISGGEWVMKAVKEMLSNDPSLSSLPLLATFLKSYAYPFLGIVPTNSTKQISTTTESGSLSEAAATDAPPIVGEQDQLIEKDVRDRFKRMCEGYFENVCKKLLIEHTVCLFFCSTHPGIPSNSPTHPPSAPPRPRSSKPRSLHPFRGDIRRSTTSIRENDQRVRKVIGKLSTTLRTSFTSSSTSPHI